MTPQEQEALFKFLMAKNGDDRLSASGYVHGVADESSGRPAPNPIIHRRAVRDLHDNSDDSVSITNDPYAYAYMEGFIDSYGEDAAKEHWSNGFEDIVTHLMYRWWRRFKL